MRADLHTHSVYSDGYYAPEELCRRAKANGVELLSITDHDTMNGDKEKRAAAERYGLLYVSGWEISAYAGESKIHVRDTTASAARRTENLRRIAWSWASNARRTA